MKLLQSFTRYCPCVLRIWVGGLYRPFARERREITKKKAHNLGVAPPTKKHNGKVCGSKTLRSTQNRACIIYHLAYLVVSVQAIDSV